jgi:hypothetical protein
MVFRGVVWGFVLIVLAGCEEGSRARQVSEQGTVIQSSDPEVMTPSRPSDDPTAHVPSGEPIVVVGRVIEAPRPPACGRAKFAVAVKYEVLRVELGELAEPEILVRTECPELDREPGDAGPIQTGDVHRLELDPTPYRTQRRVQWIPVRTDRAEP